MPTVVWLTPGTPPPPAQNNLENISRTLNLPTVISKGVIRDGGTQKRDWRKSFLSGLSSVPWGSRFFCLIK